MVLIEGRYLGSLRCEARHGPSGTTLVTDAPTDNQGRGESFSPTDLVATAFGTCVVTTIAIVAARRGFDPGAMTFRVEKHMATAPERRIAALPLTIVLPASLTPEQRAVCERAAAACPVHKSLDPGVAAKVSFEYV